MRKQLRENSKNTLFLIFDQSFDIKYYGIIEMKHIQLFCFVFFKFF